MNRRSLLVSATSALALAISFIATPLVYADSHQTAINLRLGFIPNVQNAELYIAIDQGIFERNGMAVKLIPGGPGAPNSLTELAAGTVEIALGSWVSFVDSVQLGNDFVLIGTQFQSSPLGVISLPGKPIFAAADLEGATILAQGAPAQNWVKAVLQGAGLDPKNVDFLPTGFSPEPLLAGDGDGYTAFGTNQAVTLQSMGLEPEVDFHFRSFDQLGASTIAGMFVVQRDYLEANRDLIVSFIASLIEAQQINENDVSIAAALAAEKFGVDYGLDVDQQVLQNKAQLKYVRPGGDPDFQLYSLDTDKISGPMMDTLALLGRTELPENILDYVDSSIVEDAYKMIQN